MNLYQNKFVPDYFSAQYLVTVKCSGFKHCSIHWEGWHYSKEDLILMFRPYDTADIWRFSIGSPSDDNKMVLNIKDCMVPYMSVPSERKSLKCLTEKDCYVNMVLLVRMNPISTYSWCNYFGSLEGLILLVKLCHWRRIWGFQSPHHPSYLLLSLSFSPSCFYLSSWHVNSYLLFQYHAYFAPALVSAVMIMNYDPLQPWSTS